MSKRTLDGFLSSSVFVIPVSAFTGAPLAAISIQSKMIHTRQKLKDKTVRSIRDRITLPAMTILQFQ